MEGWSSDTIKQTSELEMIHDSFICAQKHTVYDQKEI